MKLDQRIIVVAPWSSFRGQRGRVTPLAPYPMVVLDDDPRPIRVGANEVIPEAESARHIGGAE